MNLKIYTVRDRAADVYGTPFFMPSHGQAIRSFADEINNPRDGNTLNRHPQDFDLYALGEYDDQTGTFTTNTPKQIAIGADLVQRAQTPEQTEMFRRDNGNARFDEPRIVDNYGATK